MIRVSSEKSYVSYATLGYPGFICMVIQGLLFFSEKSEEIIISPPLTKRTQQ